MEELRTLKFYAPSGHWFEIREQNGEDEDILSNPKEMRNLLHLSRFISSIVIRTDVNEKGRLTMDQALDLPLLDRYCILFQSRIFSLGEDIEFSYNWKGTLITYKEDLRNFLFEDYSQIPNEEELNAKPNAIPYYPDTDIIKGGKSFKLSTGKVITWKAANGRTEQYLISLSEDKQTRNSELIGRDLQLEVNGVFEKVQNFKLFTPKEMAEIRKLVNTYDPIFQGVTEIENPNTSEKLLFPILSTPNFFFLMEA